MKIFLVICFFIVSTLNVQLSAQEIEAVVFSVPVTEKMRRPSYPNYELNREEEGWVELNFMVGIDGKAFEPVVVDIVGSDAFSREATKALLRSKFEPAYFNGEPIIGSSFFQYNFSLEGGSRGADTFFVSIYREIVEAFESKSDQESISGMLDQLIEVGARNHYENAFLNWALYLYATEFGTSYERLIYLRKVTGLEENPKKAIYMSDTTIQFARRELFNLEVSNNRLREAEEAFDMLEESGDEEGMALLKTVYDIVVDYRENEKSYLVNMVLDDTG